MNNLKELVREFVFSGGKAVGRLDTEMIEENLRQSLKRIESIKAEIARLERAKSEMQHRLKAEQDALQRPNDLVAEILSPDGGLRSLNEPLRQNTIQKLIEAIVAIDGGVTGRKGKIDEEKKQIANQLDQIQAARQSEAQALVDDLISKVNRLAAECQLDMERLYREFAVSPRRSMVLKIDDLHPLFRHLPGPYRQPWTREKNLEMAGRNE